MDFFQTFFAQFDAGELIAVALLTLVCVAVIDVKMERPMFLDEEDAP